MDSKMLEEPIINVDKLDVNVMRRIMSKVTPKNGSCWEWTGAVSGAGYPVVHVNGKYGSTLYVHQVVCELFHGDRPLGQEVRHLCNTKTCCDPAHLCWGTKSENSMDRPEWMRKETSRAGTKARYG